jgi:hypothetical protein
MKSRVIPLIGVFLAVLGLTWLSLGAQAAPPAQTYSTSTPNPDGKIIYVVQAGDNCGKISLLTGVAVNDIIALNKLDQACTIIAGQQLIIGFGGPAYYTATAGPSPTATIVVPTATPIAGGNGVVCFLMFNDLNGDGLRQTAELGVAGGAVSLTSISGLYSQQTMTVSLIDPDTTDPMRVCLENVPMGDYTVSAAVPEGYNPTTLFTYALTVVPGDISDVSFGVQLKSAGADTGSGSSGAGPSPLLGVGGAMFILGGIGLAFFALRGKKR